MNLPSVKVINDYMTLFSAFYHPYISLNIPISPRNPITFSTSQSFLSSVFKKFYPGYCIFFLLSLHWGQSCRQCFIANLWFQHVAFPHVGGWLFHDIKYPWVNLVFPIRILISLTSYCLKMLWALTLSRMCGLM